MNYFRLMVALMLTMTMQQALAGKAPANKAPTVTISAPAPGASFTTSSSIVVSATAGDADGTVAKVEFFRGTTSMGIVTTAPYSVTWSNAIAGTYSLTAKATDNLGLATTSAAVTVTVGAPKIVFSSPQNGAALYGTSATVSGTFNGDANTTVLLDNGNSSRLATINGNGFSTTVPIFLGPNTINVLVARTDKTFDTASISVTGNAAPIIVRTAPTVFEYTAPANVTFAVDAVSPLGSISKVEFYRGGNLAATATAPPYTTTFSNLTASSYSFRATAFDNNGQSASTYMSIQVSGANAVPSTALTSPASGTVLTAPATVLLAANASDTDGSIVQLDFLQNGSVIGTTNVAPYTYSWANVPEGAYSLTSRATDNRGGATTSAPISLTIVGMPTATLTAPAANASFTAPATITVSANATPSNGATVSKVEFYQGNSLIGIAATAPYTIDWTNVSAGSYQLAAKVFDSRGLSSTSTAAAVTVAAPSLAGVITAPANNTRISAPATVLVTVNADSANSTIKKIELFDNGVLLTSVEPVEPYNSYQLNYSWIVSTVGGHNLTAKVTDAANVSTTTSVVTVQVIEPRVAVTANPNASTAPGSITLSATVTGEGNPIERVDFYQGTTLLGTVNSAPFTYLWSAVPAGSYSVTAVATDTVGDASTSNAISVIVAEPSLTVTAPLADAYIDGDSVVVKGIVRSSSNSGVTVNDVMAHIADDNHFYARIPLTSGSNAVRVVLTNQAGETVTRELNVSASGASSPLNISVNNVQGFAPHSVTFVLSNPSTTDLTVGVNGGTPFTLEPGAISDQTVTLAAAGTSPVSITATDSQGASTTRDYVLIANDKEATAQRLSAMWGEMNTAVSVGDIDRALSYFSDAGKIQYGPVLRLLQPEYQQIVSSWSQPMVSQLSGKIGEFAVVTTKNGVKSLFLIYFLKSPDGVWRLVSM